MKLLSRVEKLELVFKPGPAEINAALEGFERTGHLPSSPRLKETILGILYYLREIERRTNIPPEGEKETES